LGGRSREKKDIPTEKVKDLDVLRGSHQLKKIKIMDGKERDLTCRPNAASREMGGGGGTKSDAVAQPQAPFFC
jgi:hypothetical protein